MEPTKPHEIFADAKDVQKASHAIQCILQVLTPKQKQKFVSLYMEKKDE